MSQEAKIKKQGQIFWDQNPCGGQWSSFQQKREWLLRTEPHMRNWLSDDLLKNKAVLDVGCGQGLFLSLVAERCREAVGLDLSRQSLIRARQGLKSLGLNNVRLIRADAEKLPFNNGEFDTVFCIGVLHHTPNSQQGINEIQRVLKKGGQGVLLLYRKYTPKWLAVRFLRTTAKLTSELLGQPNWLIRRVRQSKYCYNPRTGTALLELFGCPLLKTYSLRQIKKMFSSFRSINVSFTQPGFSRLLDFAPRLKPTLQKGLYWLDRRTQVLFGFYATIEVKK